MIKGLSIYLDLVRARLSLALAQKLLTFFCTEQPIVEQTKPTFMTNDEMERTITVGVANWTWKWVV